MGRVYEGIDEKLTTWLQAQPLFVVATAPLSPDGLINCSPKGGSRIVRGADIHPRGVPRSHWQRCGNHRTRARELANNPDVHGI
ncbi:hypothetical protein CBI33_14825 [Rhodococcus erythropolis]|nr:hypothetical protein CBI33_14825 [Rhodococcus erythropolis]